MTCSPPCLSLDLEVGKRDRRIHAFAAVRPDTGQRLVFRSGDLLAALARLDHLAERAAFLVGHNLIAFDLPHLTAAKPDLRLLKLPAVDTLRLNPLAFPRNPYHHLVKHYQDGQFKRARVNDPELDARLTLDLFMTSAAPCKAPRRNCCWLGTGSSRPTATGPASTTYSTNCEGHRDRRAPRRARQLRAGLRAMPAGPASARS